METTDLKDMIAVLDDQPGPGQYRCDCCGQIYDKAWSDEEATAEAQEKFGMTPDTGDMAVVCDNCWKAMGYAK